MNKKQSQNIHAKRRAKERYNIELNRKIRQELIRKIQNSKAEFIRSISNRLSVFDVEFDGNTFRVVYDKQRKNIATFLEGRMK